MTLLIYNVKLGWIQIYAACYFSSSCVTGLADLINTSKQKNKIADVLLSCYLQSRHNVFIKYHPKNIHSIQVSPSTWLSCQASSLCPNQSSVSKWLIFLYNRMIIGCALAHSNITKTMSSEALVFFSKNSFGSPIHTRGSSIAIWHGKCFPAVYRAHFNTWISEQSTR